MAHPSRRTVVSLRTRTLSSCRSHIALALLEKSSLLVRDEVLIPTRFKSSGSGYSPLNDPSSDWSNWPPKETILLDGCNYDGWLIVMEFPIIPSPSRGNDQRVFPVYFGFCHIHILMWPTKIMKGTCLSMGKLSIDHSIVSLISSKIIGIGLAHITIGAGRPCRLRGESHCKDKTELKIRVRLCINQHQ